MEIPLKTIPIEPGGYHIMVEIKVNGLKANTLVDTGASKTIMDISRVKHYTDNPDIQEFGKQLTGMGADKIQTWITTLSEIQFGSHTLNHLQIVLVDLQSINASYAIYDLPRIDVVLGGDILHRLGAVIDYSNKLLKISIKG